MGLWLGSLACLPLAAAQRSAWHVRGGLSGAMMISADQADWLGYDRPGVLGDVQLGYGVLPWLDLQVGTALGVFLSDQANGGLAAPMVGALARWPGSSVTPYVALDMGAAMTGALLLPMLRASIGLELPIAASWSLGPTLGLGNVFYSDDPGNSTDARYISLGLTLLYAHNPPPVPHKAAAPPPPAPPPPPRVVVVKEPSADLMQLVDRAVPGRTDQVELLAPVLFGFDSDELEPVGVAMLHEVARELTARPDLELVEIRAYADARGAAEYNRALAERRGQRVLEWLVAHGIDGQRLSVAPLGAADPVEIGADEQAYEQNRRVVFRVLRKTGDE
ncbi:MAG TPA: OmpA family protein [Polyangiales bacterium]|nr:OmpA family protein [Polyangiales bacterium]